MVLGSTQPLTEVSNRSTSLGVNVQEEFTVLGGIIVPSRGWKSLNIWEQF